MNLDEARTAFARLRAADSGVSPAELDEVWAALDTVDAANILGHWKGDDFATGHRLHDTLVASRWHGKVFHSADHAQPLICRDDQGNLYSDVKSGNGEASLWNVEFRGEVTATMVYDGAPIFDHFKAVDDSTLMGIMNGKPSVVLDHGQHYYFLLERE